MYVKYSKQKNFRFWNKFNDSKFILHNTSDLGSIALRQVSTKGRLLTINIILSPKIKNIRIKRTTKTALKLKITLLIRFHGYTVVGCYDLESFI